VILDCGFDTRQPGVQKTAQWLRTPFHDMITYDAATKKGGLDASLQFELGRFENFGLALNHTFADISSTYSLQNSASDLLALAMVMAVERCGGLSIPLRLGRVDATHAGPYGVPEPVTNRTEMAKAFTKAGFSQSKLAVVELSAKFGQSNSKQRI
jgi:catalase (peroxidase I)